MKYDIILIKKVYVLEFDAITHFTAVCLVTCLMIGTKSKPCWFYLVGADESAR